MNKIISYAFSSAGFPNIFLPSGTFTDDVTTIPWSRGRSILS